MSSQEIPRDPGAWSPTPHLGDRLRKPDRHLTGEAIRRCIEDGTQRPARQGRVALDAWVDGIQYRLVLEPDTREVVTGYPTRIDGESARKAGRTDGKIRAVRRAIEREQQKR